MKSSNKLKVAALVLILAVTISIKVVGLQVDKPSPEKLNAAIADLLSNAGFVVEQKVLPSGFEIIGQSPNCRITVRDVFPQGFNLIAIVAWTPNDAQLRYAFRGELFEQPPTYRATSAYFWTRTLRQFGLNIPWSPVLAIATTGACTPETLAWGDLDRE